MNKQINNTKARGRNGVFKVKEAETWPIGAEGYLAIYSKRAGQSAPILLEFSDTKDINSFIELLKDLKKNMRKAPR